MVDWPAGIVIVVVADPPEVAEKDAVPVEFEERLTTVPPPGASATLPKASRDCTVIGPRVGLVRAVPLTGLVVKANVAAAAVEMVKPLLVSEVSPVLVAVSV